MFQFINDQLLKMLWLSSLIERFMHGVLNISTSTKMGSALHFFIYDVIKIFILLAVLIFTISYIQSFFPPERTRKIIGKYNGIAANIIGALLGTITPFCSCSSIPLFIGFTSAGLPIGVTFSFLISSPLVDLASVLMLASIFNWQIALAYVLVGLMLAVIGGSFISALGMEKYVESFVREQRMMEIEAGEMAVRERVDFAIEQVKFIFNKVWMYVLIGVGIGAAIHNFIPQAMISLMLGQDKWYAVILATFVGIPMYADIFGTLPIAEALVTKGVGIGTVLSFMMAVTALSLPSIILLKNVVKTRLLIVFVSIVTVGILIIGYTFNVFGGFLVT